MNLAVILTILTFVAVFLLVSGINLAISDALDKNRRGKEMQRIKEEMERQRLKAREQAQQGATLSLDQMAQQAAMQEDMPRGPVEKLRRALEQADLQYSSISVIMISASLAIGTGTIVASLFGNAFIALGAAAIAAGLMPIYVFNKQKQRAETLRSQLPDALELMSRVLRAGQTTSQALQAVGEEFAYPIGTEFAYCYEQQNLGMSSDMALRDLAKRTGLLEIRIFVLALLVHRQSGGNLTQLLDKLSSIIRERYKMRGKIRALTAEGRLQALILLGLPFFMFLLLFAVNRPYALQLFDHPNMLAGMFASMIVGALWIRRVVNFDF